MDLFSAAGYNPEEGRGGKGNRAQAPRGLRVPLFNHKVVEEARRLAAFNPTADQAHAASEYARTIKSPKFAKQKETAVRNLFFESILGDVLGYRKFDPSGYSLAFEWPIRSGSVDTAIGRFGRPDEPDEIVAPFELKGPGTADLDAIVPGRRRSPVQQAWDYAVDAPGSKWVLVSNCVEIRLYGFGRGRDAYETFDLRKLEEPDELSRLWLVLSADRLLTGATGALLSDTDSAYKDISDELYVEYSKLREALVGYLIDFADGPKLNPLKAIEAAQKLLDRILFIAFAQHTNLLGDGHLQKAAELRNFYDPDRPLWHNFQTLFLWLYKGRRDQDIPEYNGGLFAPDPLVDSLILPDTLTVELAKLGEWDYRSDVPVTVLGHLFEQSVTDIEALKATSVGKEPPKVSQRKRHGIVYTPDIVTRFLVERTIGLTLDERFDSLLEAHGKAGAARTNGGEIFKADEQTAECAFWRDYLEALRGLTVVDPACGSGAFLVAAFDALAPEYRRVTERLADLGEPVDFDPYDEIVTKNLHGVDLSAESVEITRLSLWLKTARRKHRLQNLEATVKPGDSLIEDKAWSERPFDWQAAFPSVFKNGGFDIVIGNPPYVRMELIKPIKPYLEEHYVVASDRADLYAYFFERGVKLLKDGGRLGYISSSTFFRTGSGEELRTFLADSVAVECVIDFGDNQLFEGVTTYPAIVTLKKGIDGEGGELRFLKVEEERPLDLGIAFLEGSRPMPRSRLTGGSWRFEDEALARLRDKIAGGRKTLGEVYGPPLYGIKTGLNEAFVVDTETRDRLVARDPKSAELLKPFLRGENVKRWRVEPEGLFLINTPKGKVDIDAHPAVRDWLLPFKPELEKRATKQKWFELQQAQLADQPMFEAGGIAFPDLSQGPKFAVLSSGSLIDCTVFLVDQQLDSLAGLLNAKALWFVLFGLSNPMRGGKWRLRLKTQYVEQVPIPDMSTDDSARLTALANSCRVSASGHAKIESAVRHRILDLAAPERNLSKKLERWWELDFSRFRKEVKRAFKADIPLKERGEWEAYLAENAAEVKSLATAIEAAERDIDAIVYRLYDLTEEEIRLLEGSLEGQY